MISHLLWIFVYCLSLIFFLHSPEVPPVWVGRSPQQWLTVRVLLPLGTSVVALASSLALVCYCVRRSECSVRRSECCVRGSECCIRRSECCVMRSECCVIRSDCCVMRSECCVRIYECCVRRSAVSWEVSAASGEVSGASEEMSAVLEKVKAESRSVFFSTPSMLIHFSLSHIKLKCI